MIPNSVRQMMVLNVRHDSWFQSFTGVPRGRSCGIANIKVLEYDSSTFDEQRELTSDEVESIEQQ